MASSPGTDDPRVVLFTDAVLSDDIAQKRKGSWGKLWVPVFHGNLALSGASKLRQFPWAWWGQCSLAAAYVVSSNQLATESEAVKIAAQLAADRFDKGKKEAPPGGNGRPWLSSRSKSKKIASKPAKTINNQNRSSRFI